MAIDRGTNNYEHDDTNREIGRKIMAKYANPETRKEAIWEMCETLDYYMTGLCLHYSGIAGEFEDLKQLCRMAIIEDIDRYDPEKSSPLKFFKMNSFWRVLNLEAENAQHVTNHYAHVIKQIRAVEASLGEDAVLAMPDYKLGLMIQQPETTVREAREMMHIQVCSDEEVLFAISDMGLSPEQKVIRQDMEQLAIEVIKALDPIKQKIFIKISLQDNINFSEATKELESDSEFAELMDGKKITQAFVQKEYSLARKQIFMQNSIKQFKDKQQEDLEDEDEYDEFEDYDYIATLVDTMESSFDEDFSSLPAAI